MKPHVPDYSEKNSPGNPTDFSLVQGGLFFRLLRWARLSDDALMLVRRRVIVLALLAWLPLLILTTFEGHVLGGVRIGNSTGLFHGHFWYGFSALLRSRRWSLC